ncbi:hypothetical protein [Chryseobacterium sp.]|uniref:hypothetical protein n=1 Tax=Chryseobacterium sp. TaxID=1871047 RepID=UPI00321911C9
MSNIVFLTPTKLLVREKKLNSYELEVPEIDTKGVLKGFIVKGIKYIFIDQTKYLPHDQARANLVVGFIKHESYIDYMNSPMKDIYNFNHIINPSHWFDSNFEKAQIGDLFSIEKLETSPAQTDNFKKYFIHIKCEFKITDLTIDFSDSSKYPPEEPDLTKPNYCKIKIQDKSGSLENSLDGRFFKKNFGSKVDSLSIGINSKEILYIGIVKICWRITNILKDILETIAIKKLNDIQSIVTTATPPSGTDIRTYINGLGNLSEIDKTIAILLVDWGLRSYDDTLELFPLDVNKDQFYDGYYVPFQNYYNTLINVYANIAYTKEEYLFNVTSDPSTWLPKEVKEQSDLRLELLTSIIPDGAINFFSFDTKIKILKTFAENPIYESREDTVIKIIRSIQVVDAFKFLNTLQNEVYIIDNKSVTLFERLYQKINDQILFFGKNNRREFINRLYGLWYVSSFNPYNLFDLSLGNDNTLVTKNYYNDFYKNKPVILNYNSKKFFGFFVDNMDFKFNNKIIEVYEEKQVGQIVIVGGEVVPDKKKIKVGDYSFYTAISIKEFHEGDVAVKLPAVSLVNTGSNTGHIIPIFYLKYLDDFGDKEDIWTAIGLTVDIALTFTGIGNLSKLRHLRHFSKLGRIALGEALPAAERILALEALSGTASFVELTASVASTIIKYYSNECKLYIDDVKTNINDNNPNGQLPSNTAYKWCKNLDQFLFWIQLASSGADFIADLMVRKTAQKMLDEGIPNDFLSLTDPESGIKAYDVVLRFADNLPQMKNTFFSKIRSIIGNNSKLENDIQNLLSPTEQYMFILDFGKAESAVLSKLNGGTGVSFVREWKEISVLRDFRKDLMVLKAKRYFNSTVQILSKLKSLTEIDGDFTQGGHLGDHLFDASRNIFAYLDETKPLFIAVYGKRIYKQSRNGIKIRKKGWVNNNKNPAIFNGEHVKNKDFQTWVENMSETEFDAEMSVLLAEMEKANLPYTRGQKHFSSHMSDGCPVTLVMEEEITINGVVYYNYVSAVLFKPNFY